MIKRELKSVALNVPAFRWRCRTICIGIIVALAPSFTCVIVYSGVTKFKREVNQSMHANPDAVHKDFWRQRVIEGDSLLNNGNGYATHMNSDALAWGESYLLQSYVVMYQSYRDKSFLDKITNHFDQMLAHLSRMNRDGFPGWHETKYSLQKVMNGGFEQTAPRTLIKSAAFKSPYNNDPSLPVAWVRWQSSPSTAYRSSAAGDFHAGSAGLVVRTNGISWQVVEQGLSTYVPDAAYQVSFYGRTNGIVNGYVDVIDTSDRNKTLGHVIVNDTSWKAYSFSFTAPTISGHALKLRLYQTRYDVAGGAAYFDDVSLRKISDYMVHDGMILYPIAQFVRIVHDDPKLWASYKRKADEYLALIERQVIPKWEPSWREIPNTTPQQGIYVFTDSESVASPGYVAGSSLPHNQYLAFARLLLECYRVTGKTAYLDKAIKLGNTFKAHLRINPTVPSAYVWNYADIIMSEDVGRRVRPEDTSHANLDIGAAIDFYHEGHVFSAADMIRFTSTLLDVIWNHSLEQPKISGRVSGASGQEMGWNLTDWSKLAEFDIRVWQIAQKLYSDLDVKGKTNPALILAMAEVAEWNPERILNRDFEYFDKNDASLPDDWERWQSTPATAYRSTRSEESFSGRAGLVVKTNGTSPQVIEQTLLSYHPGETYMISFSGKTNGEVAGVVDIIDASDGDRVLVSSPFNGTSWTRYTFNFTAPSVSGRKLKLRCHPATYNSKGGVVYFDDFEMSAL